MPGHYQGFHIPYSEPRPVPRDPRFDKGGPGSASHQGSTPVPDVCIMPKPYQPHRPSASPRPLPRRTAVGRLGAPVFVAAHGLVGSQAPSADVSGGVTASGLQGRGDVGVSMPLCQPRPRRRRGAQAAGGFFRRSQSAEEVRRRDRADGRRREPGEAQRRCVRQVLADYAVVGPEGHQRSLGLRRPWDFRRSRWDESRRPDSQRARTEIDAALCRARRAPAGLGRRRRASRPLSPRGGWRSSVRRCR